MRVCLNHATIAESLEPSVWVVLTYALRERERRLQGEAGAGYLSRGSNEV